MPCYRLFGAQIMSYNEISVLEKASLFLSDPPSEVLFVLYERVPTFVFWQC
jgi:hypothetical protein